MKERYSLDRYVEYKQITQTDKSPIDDNQNMNESKAYYKQL